jgi:outer membrane protein assembly factor BamB
MFEGSENSIFYIWKLNRGYDADGLVTVNPVLLLEMETWTDELLDLIRPSGYLATSVENSAALFEGRVYFANSAGRVLGLDITNVDRGIAPIVFDYWVGDDVDASIVVDEEGMIYVAAQYERYLERAESLGQLIKLDPYTSGDPYVWGMYSLVEPPADRLWRTDIPTSAKGGLWSTPALGDGVLYALTNKGFLVVVDRETGAELWVDEVGNSSWSSPVVIDDHLLVATKSGYLRSYDISTPAEPVREWEVKVGEGQIEATPAVWEGRIYVGTRDGFMYALGE